MSRETLLFTKAWASLTYSLDSVLDFLRGFLDAE